MNAPDVPFTHGCAGICSVFMGIGDQNAGVSGHSGSAAFSRVKGLTMLEFTAFSQHFHGWWSSKCSVFMGIGDQNAGIFIIFVGTEVRGGDGEEHTARPWRIFAHLAHPNRPPQRAHA